MINLNAITGNKMKRILVCLMAVILPLFGMIAQEKKTITLNMYIHLLQANITTVQINAQSY